jgi:hypothetical protein
VYVFVLIVESIDLPAGHSITNLSSVARVLGGENMFISSTWDDSQGALMEPDRVLANYGIGRGA